MRRKNDQYFTPRWATEELLRHIEVRPTHSVLEPCVGDGAISNVLREKTSSVYTNDIDEHMWASYHEDAASPDFWKVYGQNYDWIISNPPFSLAIEIVSQAVAASIWGTAMLLRLSFLEPTLDRGPWLAENPPDQIIVLPRISFTGDGKTDSVTTAWFIWQPEWDYAAKERILIIPRP